MVKASFFFQLNSEQVLSFEVTFLKLELIVYKINIDLKARNTYVHKQCMLIVWKSWKKNETPSLKTWFYSAFIRKSTILWIWYICINYLAFKSFESSTFSSTPNCIDLFYHEGDFRITKRNQPTSCRRHTGIAWTLRELSYELWHQFSCWSDDDRQNTPTACLPVT